MDPRQSKNCLVRVLNAMRLVIGCNDGSSGSLFFPTRKVLVPGDEACAACEGEIGPYPGRKYRKEVDYSQMNARRSVSS